MAGKQKSISHLIGVRFGLLTLIEDLGRQNEKRMVMVRCDCGVEKQINIACLKMGYSQHCGCQKNKEYTDRRILMRNQRAVEATGIKYNRLTVIGIADVQKRGKCTVRAFCECGVVGDYVLKALRNGRIKSCGCLQKEIAKKLFTKHGFSKNHSLYNVWCGMNNRCESEKCEQYKNYGGNGVVVCPEWKDDFMNFYNWAVDKWQEGLQLDKDILSPVKPGKVYGPEFCCFVTQKENVRNKINNVFITYNGETMCMGAWSEKLNIPYHLIQRRHKKGWTPEEVFNHKKYFPHKKQAA